MRPTRKPVKPLRQVTFINVRGLNNENRNLTIKPFQTMMKRSGVHGHSTMETGSGEMFALMERGRSIGGVWIRTWPTDPATGDAHAALSLFRFRDYPTLIAFDMLLIQRASVMGLKKWRLVAREQDTHVATALKFLRFREVSRQVLPGFGRAVILEREVV